MTGFIECDPARIVEIVSALPYEEFLQRRFFDPLGMAETTFWPSESQVARLAGGDQRSLTQATGAIAVPADALARVILSI